MRRDASSALAAIASACWATRSAASTSAVLAGLQRGGRDLVDLVAEQLAAPLELAVVGQQLGGGGDGRAPRAPRLTDGCDIVAAEAVEQRELVGTLRQALLLVLAVDLGQPCPERGQPADCHRPVVDARHRATVGAHLAPHDGHPALSAHDVVERRIGRGRHVVEDGLDAEPLGAGAHLVSGGARAERERQRVHHERLPRAGLAGEHREAGLKRQPDALDARRGSRR